MFVPKVDVKKVPERRTVVTVDGRFSVGSGQPAANPSRT